MELDTGFKKLLASQNPDDVLRPNEEGRLAVRKPLKPPSRSTSFKCSLSRRGLDWDALRNARDKVDNYPKELEHLREMNAHALLWLKTQIAETSSPRIAVEAMKKAGIGPGATNDIQLSQRKVSQAMLQAEEMVARRKDMELAVAKYLKPDDGTGLGPFWNMSPFAEEFLGLVTAHECSKLPAYDTTLRHEDLQLAEGAALLVYGELTDAGMTEDDLQTYLAEANQADNRDADNRPDVAKLIDRARQETVRKGIKSWLDPYKEQSLLLCQTALGHLSQPALENISDSITKGFTIHIRKLAWELGCNVHAGEILNALKPTFASSIDEHIKTERWKLQVRDYFTVGDGQGAVPFSDKPEVTRKFLRLIAVATSVKLPAGTDALRRGQGEALLIHDELLNALGRDKSKLRALLIHVSKLKDDQGRQPGAAWLLDRARQEAPRFAKMDLAASSGKKGSGRHASKDEKPKNHAVSFRGHDPGPSTKKKEEKEEEKAKTLAASSGGNDPGRMTEKEKEKKPKNLAASSGGNKRQRSTEREKEAKDLAGLRGRNDLAEVPAEVPAEEPKVDLAASSDKKDRGAVDKLISWGRKELSKRRKEKEASEQGATKSPKERASGGKRVHFRSKEEKD